MSVLILPLCNLTKTSRKGSCLSLHSIVNCILGWIEFSSAQNVSAGIALFQRIKQSSKNRHHFSLTYDEISGPYLILSLSRNFSSRYPITSVLYVGATRVPLLCQFSDDSIYHQNKKHFSVKPVLNPQWWTRH